MREMEVGSGLLSHGVAPALPSTLVVKLGRTPNRPGAQAGRWAASAGKKSPAIEDRIKEIVNDDIAGSPTDEQKWVKLSFYCRVRDGAGCLPTALATNSTPLTCRFCLCHAARLRCGLAPSRPGAPPFPREAQRRQPFAPSGALCVIARSQITRNWAGKPLRSFATMRNYIRSTTTTTGLTVNAFLVDRAFQKGRKLSKEQRQTIQLTRRPICPTWNYMIAPTSIS